MKQNNLYIFLFYTYSLIIAESEETNKLTFMEKFSQKGCSLYTYLKKEIISLPVIFTVVGISGCTYYKIKNNESTHAVFLVALLPFLYYVKNYGKKEGLISAAHKNIVEYKTFIELIDSNIINANQDSKKILIQFLKKEEENLKNLWE